MAKLTIDVQPRGIASAYIDAPFDQGMEALQKKGYPLISLEQNAQLQIQESREASISKNGNWTREGVIYVPNKGKFLTPNSPILTYAQEATQCHRNGQKYYLTGEQVEQALEDAVEITTDQIPTTEFKNHPLTVSAFKTFAEAYGQFLQEAGIMNLSVYTVDVSDKPFASQIWFRGLDDGSELNGVNLNLDYNSRVRGVQVIQGPQGRAKNLEECSRYFEL